MNLFEDICANFHNEKIIHDLRETREKIICQTDIVNKTMNAAKTIIEYFQDIKNKICQYSETADDKYILTQVDILYSEHIMAQVHIIRSKYDILFASNSDII